MVKFMKLLLVEDDLTILDGLKFCLEKENFEVLTSSTGLNALEKVSEHKIDLLILDINLPDMDAYETLAKIKENKELER